MIERFIPDFSNYLKMHNYADETIEHYAGCVRRFAAFLSEKNCGSLSGITRDSVKEYQTHLFYTKYNGKPLSLFTQSNKLYAIRTFCRFLIEENFLLYDPFLAVAFPKHTKRLPAVILNQSEVKKMLSLPDMLTPLGIRDRAILEILYSTGIRNTELRKLRLQDIDLRRCEIRIMFAKGGKSRIAPLGEAASHFLEIYLEKSRPLLISENSEKTLFLSYRGKPLVKNSLAGVVKKYAKMANIHKKAGCHTLRHTCATHMLKGKADIRFIQELLGHESLTTTEIYTKVELTDLKRVHKKCHPRNRM